MKLSNNALNFLLAQYRAIFKRAYVKGLASAVIVTAGLAAGQAQAEPNYYFWDYSSAWTTKTEAAASDGLVAGIIGGNNVGSHTETVVSGGNLTIGGGSSSALSGVTSGSAVAGWGSAETGDLTVQNNTITITGSGTVTKDGKDGRGFVYGGWVQSLAGKAAANDNHVIISGKTDKAAAASDGLLGAYVEGHLGASAVGNTIVVSGSSSSSLQTISTSDTSTAIGAQIMPIKLKQVTATGEFTANQNQVSLDYVNVSTAQEDDVVNIFGANFNMTNADATKSTLNAQGNIVTLNNAEIDTASGSIGNILGATHEGTFGGNINFNANEVKLSDTSFTASGSMTLVGANINGSGTIISASGNSVTLDTVAFESKVAQSSPKGNVAGTLIQGTSTKIVATNNQAQILDSTALNVDAVAGAYINNTNNSAQVALTVTDNHVEIGADTNVTAPNVAGAVVVVSGSQLDTLNADGNSVTIAGTVSGDVKAVLFTPTGSGNPTVNANATLSFLNNDVTLQNGGEIQSGSFVGGAGKNSVAEIASGSTYTANTGNSQDIASDVIKIAGEIKVEDGNTLDISGFYKDGLSSATSYNANLTTVADTATIVNSGTINAYGKMVVEDGATLTAGNDAAAIIVDGSSNKQNINSSLAEDQLVEGASFGHLVIAKDTLTDYLNGSSFSGALVLSNATLEFNDSREIDLAKDFQLSGGAATASGAGVITVSGSTIKAENLAVSNKLTNVTEANGLALEATGTLRLGSSTYTGSGSLGFASAEAKNLKLERSGSGAFVLADDITLDASTGSEDNYSAGTGWINGADLTLSGNSTLTIAYGTYSTTNHDINVANGTLQVGGAPELKYDADDNLLDASLTLADLTVAANSIANVADNGTLTVDGLSVASGTTGAGLTVAGTMTVNGHKVTTEDDNPTTTYGINIGANSVLVDQGGLLTFTGAAVEALKYTSTSGETTGYFDAADSYAADGITLNAGGTVRFDFAEGTSFNTDALTELREELFNTTGGNVEGIISLGAGSIAGIEADTDGKYDWNDLESISEFLPTFEFDALKAGVVKNIAADSQVRGHFGALESSSLSSGDKISIVGNSSLNNAATNNGKFASGVNGAVLGLDIQNGSYVELNNGGAIGDVILDADSTLAINADQDITAPAETVIASIDGEDATAEFNLGVTRITGNTNVGTLITTANSNVTFGGTTTVGARGSTSTEVTELLGTNTFVGTATFNTETEISGVATAFQDGVTFNKWAGIYGDTTVSGGAVLSSGAEIGGAATLTADSIELSGSGIRFSVGEEDYVENGQTHSGSTGYLQTASMVLNGNTLIVDPSYDHATSIAAIEDFDDVVNNDEDAGTFSGTIFVGQNAALGVGQDITVAAVAEFIKQYQNSQGALIQDQVGSVLYLDGMLTAATGSQLILDSQHTKTQVFDGSSTTPALISDGSTYWGKFGTETTARQADLYLGQNTIMAVSDNILSQGAAIHFESGDAAIMAQSVKDSSDAAKIVLDGNGFLDSRSVTLFTDTGSNTGVKILGDQDIRVETLNGVMYFTLVAGTETTGGTLKLDTTKIDTAYLGATDVSRDLLFAYASQTANWDEYFDQANLDKADTDETKVQRERLHGATASSNLYTYDSTNGFQLSQDAQAAGYQTSDFVVIEHTDDEGNTTAEVYHRAYNDLLERIVRDTNGAAADGAALQGVFGGAAQAALLAARTSQDAVAGRTGMGATKSALTFADNGQGAGLWVAPIYVSQDSDGFAVSNKDYGVDIDLYGVALGGDYTLANGLRIGAFFNVGSGDADGNGQAGGVSNDFDYYGVGLYAGYSIGQFSLVGDVSYTVVDSDIDASTQVGSIKSSFDTDNISVGVTGQYEFVLGGAQITPHAGLRYSALSFDDSTFAAGGYDNGGHSELDDVNVFSIPVGVTVAKEFAFDTWTVKPSLDVTLQGNFGDDELDSNAQWDGVAWNSTYTAEFLDNFTYGATLGVAASTGSFSAGLGLGYTGSENTDEFSATANARFTF